MTAGLGSCDGGRRLDTEMAEVISAVVGILLVMLV